MTVFSDYLRRGRLVLILFMVAVVLRAGWVATRYSSDRSAVLQYPDEEAYCLSARSLAAGDGLIDEFGYRATYMPGYPAFLSVFMFLPRSLFWARIGQALIGGFAAPAVFLLALRWYRMLGGADPESDSGYRVALIAGMFVAVDPFLVFFSGLLLSETLFTTVLVAAWIFVLGLCDSRKPCGVGWAALTGVLLWLCIMLRPSSAFLVVVVPVLVLICRCFNRSAVLSSLVVVIVVVAGLLPWAARNEKVIGQWRWLTTRGGISLYDGVQPGATGASNLAHTKSISESLDLDEPAWDAYFRNAAMDVIRDDPGRVIRLSGSKFLRMWNLVPNVEGYRQGGAALLSAIWMLMLLFTAVAGWYRCRSSLRAWPVLLLPVLAFTLLHMVFVGSVRYRVPVMPFVMVFSALGVLMIWDYASRLFRRI